MCTGLRTPARTSRGDGPLVHDPDHQPPIGQTGIETGTEATCPDCAAVSTAVRSRYLRRPADLPVGGRPVSILLAVRQLFCPNPGCARRTFAEQFEDQHETRPYTRPADRATPSPRPTFPTNWKCSALRSHRPNRPRTILHEIMTLDDLLCWRFVASQTSCFQTMITYGYIDVT
jgi:hypothetical protein